MKKEKRITKKKNTLFQAAVFDFDFTLADTSKGVAESINFALSSLRIPTVSYEAVCKTIGMSLTETFLKLAGQEHFSLSKMFVRLFTERADQVVEKMSILYDSVPPSVLLLKQHGISLGIVSTKFHHRIEAILRRENLLDKFDVIIGGEDVSKNKPDPEGLWKAIERLDTSRQNTLYIGDSVIDAETARKGNVPFAAVLTGITKRSEFKKFSTHKVANDLYQLINWII